MQGASRSKINRWLRTGSRWAFGLLLVSALSSCVYADYPLSANCFKDDLLCGKWRLADEKPGEQLELNISTDKSKWYKIQEIERSPSQDKVHRAEDRCYPTLSKGGNFLNVEFRLPVKQEGTTREQTVQKFMFVKYAVTKNELWLWNISEEQLINDIHSKILKGELDNESTPWRIVRLHDRGAHLLRYFQTQSTTSLFAQVGHFKRV